MHHISPVIDEAIAALSRLPGVGRKTAQRMVFHLLRRDQPAALAIGEVLPKLIATIKHCQQCRAFTSQVVCELCSDRHHAKQLCIVQSPTDIFAIEGAGAFHGRYFVLHGTLSPIDGIGPDELGIASLEHQVSEGLFEEIIIATNGTMDGETTAHFLQLKLEQYPVTISRLAQGIPMGGELEYTDSPTLAQAVYNRQPMKNRHPSFD